MYILMIVEEKFNKILFTKKRKKSSPISKIQNKVQQQRMNL